MATDRGADPHSGWVLRRYHARVAAGLCGLCGKVPEIPGRALCNACGAKNAEYCRTRYHTDVARRRCVCCHEPLRETEWRRYGQKYGVRFWTAKPTDEEREAAAWPGI